MGYAFFDFLGSLNFFEILSAFYDSSYYSLVFPFLILFAFFHTILSYVKIFQNKAGKPINPVISLVAFLISIYGIKFETSAGYGVSDLMQMVFPNISALTIGFFGVYVVGAMFGKDFFRDLFSSKKNTSFIYFVAGGIGLASIIYYTGIVMGFWNYSTSNLGNLWNFVIAVFLLILGIVFIISGMLGVGVVFLFVFITYVLNFGEGNILEYFIDPVIFIFTLILILLSWLNSDRDKKLKLAKDLQDQKKSREKIIKDYGREPKRNESRIFDVVDEGYHKNLKKWNDLYPNESWEDY